MHFCHIFYKAVLVLQYLSSTHYTDKIFRKDTSKIIGMSGESKQNKTKVNSQGK